MEHRWGQRFAAKQPVRLVSGDVAAEALLINASLSGAYVVTKTLLQRDRRVYIQVPMRPQMRLCGFVVRTEGAGVALEWDEFASPSVLSLLLTTRAGDAQGRLHGLDVAPEQSLAIAPTGLQSRHPVIAQYRGS
jgi:hypothetical protein